MAVTHSYGRAPISQNPGSASQQNRPLDFRLGSTTVIRHASSSAKIDAAFAVITRERPDALSSAATPFSLAGRFNSQSRRRAMLFAFGLVTS
jgi:hypothetical protein